MVVDREGEDWRGDHERQHRTKENSGDSTENGRESNSGDSTENGRESNSHRPEDTAGTRVLLLLRSVQPAQVGESRSAGREGSLQEWHSLKGRRRPEECRAGEWAGGGSCGIGELAHRRSAPKVSIVFPSMRFCRQK
jgi:hypothetical protein